MRPFAVLGAASAADVITTHEGLERGCHEANPLFGRRPSTAVLVASHAVPLLALVWYSRSHPVSAWVPYTAAAILTAVAVHNATLSCRRLP